MKRVISIFIVLIVCTFSGFLLVGCSNNEIDKVSKNLTTYAIEATLNDEAKTLSASQSVDYLNCTGDTLEFLCFHLYPRAFREGALIKPYTKLTEATCFPAGVSYGDITITNLKVNAIESPYELAGEDEDILKVSLETPLENQKRAKIDIEYKVTIPNSTHRLGWYESNINLGNWYPIVCAYENGEFDMSPYFATGDPFFSDIANYNVKITYPEKYLISTTGSSNVSVENGAAIMTSEAKAVRDFAMCLSSNSKVESLESGKTKVSYMSCLEDEEILTIIHLIREVVEFFSKIFGEYPYKTLTVVKTPFVYGGMEYPNLVFVSDSVNSKEELHKVVVHEIAHQWWYGIVGNNETKEAWLDESLSEYSAALFFKEHPKYGISYDDFVSQAMSSYLLYVDVISTIKGDVNTKMDLAVNEYQNDYEYSYMVYIKGVIMFDSLKNMVGENKVLAGLKKYYQNNKFKIATKDDFFNAFKSACHTDLNGFFQGFLDGSTIISNIN